jgi:PhnB protein
MKTNVAPIPQGYTAITPYLCVKDAAAALEFYKKAFGAKEIGRITVPGGFVGHAEIEIGGARLMLASENPQWGNVSAQTLGGSPISICLYVENVDEVFASALREGATVTGEMEVKDQFHGDRSGTVLDPFGYKWTIMTHIEDLTFEEVQKRSDAMFGA